MGLMLVLATAGAQRLCSAVRGTSTCGGSGVFLLLAILGLGAILGARLLRSSGTDAPLSTSVLAIAMIGVFALVFLVDQLFEWWMVLVIPLVAVGAFLLSRWVSITFAEPTGVDQD